MERKEPPKRISRMSDKRKLKEQYKLVIQPMGVYQIKNRVNGKVFIGTARNLPGRINSQKFQLKLGSHRNKDLQNEFFRFGEENFTFEVLDWLEPKEDPLYDYTEDLTVLQQIWMEKLKPYGEQGYHHL
jgi:group I intron endonuclease